ncbi:MAG: FdhF/YdeP family oxidoreductase [Blastocatellia bacterium]|nr:FdhF/YdeP family oxidoreductase [Blastocatellia bacterium]
MDNDSYDQCQAQPPEAFTGLDLKSPSESAGGIPAVISSLKHAFGEMGVVRSFSTLNQMNQKGGFDCMSCAWPDPDGERSHLGEYCENGAKAVADEATTKKVTPEFFAQHSIAELSQQSDFWLNKQGRLTHPMVLKQGASHYEPIAWDEAFALLAQELKALDSPHEALFYTSGRTSNEAAFLYQLFVRMFGTNNLPDCSNMCHESSGTALIETIGIGKGTVTLEDFDKAQAIIVIGQNPGTNHPRMLTALQQAKRHGAKIITINPLPEAGLIRFKYPQEFAGIVGKGTALTDVFLQVRINGDVAVLKGLMKGIVEANALDYEFINAKTEGFGEFIEALCSASWDEIVTNSGVAKSEIQQAVQILCKSTATITCWAMGLTQHKNAVATIQEIVNLALLQGNIGRPGAGLCPVRGHSNVQGDRTMGIWEKPKPQFLDALKREFHFEPPREHGFDTVEAIKAMHEGRATVFFAMGGNFLSATPDTEFTAAALRRCKLTAHVATKLNRSHLITGKQALILPCLGRTEVDVQARGAQFVSTENSMGVVQSSQGANKAASEYLLSEPMIVAKLAQAVLGNRSSMNWDEFVADYDHIRAAIERTIPGFENYNARVRQPGGFYLPNGPREGHFPTPSGKAHFTVHPIPSHELQNGELVMMTIRSHDQFNTTIYGLDDRYRGIFNERRVVMMNVRDIDELGFSAGEVVDLVGVYNGETRIAHKFIIVAYDIPRRCCATYFPEANVLVPIDSVAEKSNTPVSKYVVIRLRRDAGC